jgi:hypothetical protein
MYSEPSSRIALSWEAKQLRMAVSPILIAKAGVKYLPRSTPKTSMFHMRFLSSLVTNHAQLGNSITYHFFVNNVMPS